MTQKERLATLEAQQGGHEREHEYMSRLWAAHLKAIEARLGKIEAALNSWRAELNGGSRSNGSTARRRISRRDVGVSGGTVAMATALWWVVRLLQTAGG